MSIARGACILERMRFTVLLSLLFALALAAPAAAQDGVFVDPDSPSGKEYAIPLDSARRQTSPRKPSTSRSAQEKAPLFGEGIRPDEAEPPGGRDDDGAGAGAAGGKGSGSGGSGSGGGSGGEGSGSASGGVPPSQTPPEVRQAIASGSDGGGTNWTFAIVGAIVVLVCVGAVATGQALRRRPPQHPAESR